MSPAFWITMLVMAMFVVAILTSSYNEDQTNGL